MPKQYDRVYTIGCFDYFHQGHIILLNKMRELGKEVIVGIHDDNSIEKLKHLSMSEHEPLDIRMRKLKPYADIIFVISSTDPSIYLECVINKLDNKENACFIRGDDMPKFPARQVIEEKIMIHLEPYTHGISSTQIRKDIKDTV